MTKTVWVMFGSRTVEHDVSITSAYAAMIVLERLWYNVVPIYIWQNGKRLVHSDFKDINNFKNLEKREWLQTNILPTQDNKLQLKTIKPWLLNKKTDLTIDIVFPIFHGKNWEDGATQGLCELLKVPYVWPSIAACAIGMDKDMMKAVLHLYKKNLTADQLPDLFVTIDENYNGNIDSYVDEMFEKSIFANKERMMKFLNKPKMKTLNKDLAFNASNSLQGVMGMYGGQYRNASMKVNDGMRFFIAGLREMNPDKKYYPNANSSMRFSYGTVQDYYPADAVHFDYITHLSGAMEKEDPSNPDFVVSEKLKELYETKDYGRYGQDGKLIVCFLSTNDITGGNSGSPVMNGKGELIGIAFDGNWEAMSGDIAFEPELQRTINVDIRYVLFVIDKYAGAQNLINELTIVK